MDNTWQLFGLYFGLDFLVLCSGHPIDPKDLTDSAPVAAPLLGFALLVASVVCLAACVCCRQQQRKGFKAFTDSTSNQSLHHAGRGFTNPGLTPGSELAIFPPPGAVAVTFEPLPNIVPARSRKPPAYNSTLADGLTDTDWFIGPQIDFPRQQLHYLRECGRGWFGRVVEGEAKGLKDNRQSKVVVKILREDATQGEQKFFLNEVKPYRDLNHVNVLKLVGRCLETNPYLILLEACTSGDLKSFLAGNVTSSSALVQQGMCLRMMCQVASGLQHMVQHGFVHTDLAARNCLVTSDLTVKVGDYGTSIETFKSDYYITEDVAIPIRWCSPETLHCTDTTIETKPVTVAANVWSLGVVLWEICEFGHLPYSELTDDQVIIRVLCQEGVRLGCSTLHSLHSAHLYSLMQMCWQVSSKRPSIEHILAMLLHLQTSTVSDTDEDFERRWETLKPNTIPITDNHVPEVTLEAQTIKSDFDSGVDLEIKTSDSEVIDLTKRLSIEGVNLSPSIAASPQLSVTSSSGGEFFTSSGLSSMQRHLSPSMTNLRGSVEDITKPVEEKTETVTEEFDSWLKGVDTTSEEDVKFVRKISEAIKDLDDALALEKTSSSEGSSRQESPLKDSVTLDENPVLDFRLGPIGYKDSGMQLDSLQEDSLIRRDSSTDTEEETWRGRIERGEFSEKVKEKSRSVADLMILTHIENSDGSDESDSLPSLTRQYSIEKVKRYGNKLSPMMTSIGFGSEGNIRSAVLGEEFQESLKQLQAEWRIKESESRENSLLEQEALTLLQKDKMDFLSNEASEKNSLLVNNSLKATVPSQVNIDSNVPSLEVDTQDCKVLNRLDDNMSILCSKVNTFLKNEKEYNDDMVTGVRNKEKLENDESVHVNNLEEQNINKVESDLDFVKHKVVGVMQTNTRENSKSVKTNQTDTYWNIETNVKLYNSYTEIDETLMNTDERKRDVCSTSNSDTEVDKIINSNHKNVNVEQLSNTNEVSKVSLRIEHSMEEEQVNIEILEKNIKKAENSEQANNKNVNGATSHKIIKVKNESENNYVKDTIDNVERKSIKEIEKDSSFSTEQTNKLNSDLSVNSIDKTYIKDGSFNETKTKQCKNSIDSEFSTSNFKLSNNCFEDNTSDELSSFVQTLKQCDETDSEKYQKVLKESENIIETYNSCKIEKELNVFILDGNKNDIFKEEICKINHETLQDGNNIKKTDSSSKIDKDLNMFILEDKKNDMVEKEICEINNETLEEHNNIMKIDNPSKIEKELNTFTFKDKKNDVVEKEICENYKREQDDNNITNIGDSEKELNVYLSVDKMNDTVVEEICNINYKTVQENDITKNANSNKIEKELNAFILEDQKNNLFKEVTCQDDCFKEEKKIDEKFKDFASTVNLKTVCIENETVVPHKVPIITVWDNFNADDLNPFDDHFVSVHEQTENHNSGFINNEKFNNFLPEIVVTEASILDIDSEPEETMPLENVSHPRRKIRIMVSSSDDSDDEIDFNQFKFSEQDLTKCDVSDSVNSEMDTFVASTPFVRNKRNCFNTENNIDVNENSSPSTFVITSTSDKFKTDENESCVILGSCEDYTLDYFKGLKTTFGKPNFDVDSNDELSKSDAENEDKEKHWNDFLSHAPVSVELSDNIQVKNGETFTKVMDDFEVPKKINSDFILNEKLLNKCDIITNEGSELSEVCFSDKNFVDMPDYKLSSVNVIDRPVDMFNGFKSKDEQMEEVKHRLEDVAKFSQGFCLKGPSTSVEDEEDGKFLTPDDERSSDSGFRDKGSLSESVEDACDEKYNLEDIEAELEEVYSKNKSDQDSPSSCDEQDKTFIISEPKLKCNILNENIVEENEKLLHNENGFSLLRNNIELEMNNDLENKEIKLNKTEVNTLDPEEVFCLSSEGMDKSVDFAYRNQDEDRFNKLDSALDSDIDLFFETNNDNKANSGWYLHPPVTEKLTKDDQANGWLPAPISAEDTTKDNSYVSFHIDEEFVTAIRNELREKLPCAQNPERQESEDDSPEEERTDMVIQYNTYPAPLSPILEERESLSSNQSSLLLDDQKSSDSSGKSSPILFLDLPRETENYLEDVIQNEMDIDSESTESDTAIVVEDLEEKEKVKISENIKDDCDDLLIIDTETNCATLLESPKPKSQLAFVKQIHNDEDNSSGVDSDTYILARLGDESDKQTLYTPDSVSPLSTGSSRTGAAISFSSSETGNLSGFYLSPSSVRSDLFDSGPPSLPFDLGQTFDTVEEISIKPNNEAAEIVQELVDIGILQETDYTCSNKGEDRAHEIVWNIGKNFCEPVDEIKIVGMTSEHNEADNNKDSVINPNDSLDNLISSKKSPVIESLPVQHSAGSQDWLQSVLFKTGIENITKDSKMEPVSLTTENWPTIDELLPNKASLINNRNAQKLETDLTPDSPSIDLNEVVGKCDINSTLALTTPNFSLSDESKDNSQLSSFSSTPTLETVKCISDKLVKDSFSENVKTIPKSVVPLSVLADIVVQRSETRTVNDDVTPEDERERKLQGMTLALEPMLMSKAPMPSPEDADKGLWRPTIGQLLELTNQQIEQDDMMTTSFIDADNNDAERYTPDWESDTSDESEEHSSSSGEFIWKGQEEGGEEEAVDEEEEDDEERDDSSCGSTTEFVPSSWDSSATPTKSALRSAEKTSSEKKNVWFKLQKYHCVYEYPKEASESEDDEDDEGSRRRTWQTPTFDYSTYADWELGEGEVEVEGGDSDTEEGAASGDKRQPPEYDFYRLSGLDFDVGYMTSDDGEFYISSSAKPFHQFLTDEASGSEFFPGARTEATDDFLVEFNPLASDTQPVLIDNAMTKKAEMENIDTEKKTSPTKPNNLYIPPEPSPSEESSSAEVSPGLGELRHTRQRLKLDLLGAVKGVAETVKGEASLLDSGEDSGIESNGQNGQVRLKDCVESSSEA